MRKYFDNSEILEKPIDFCSQLRKIVDIWDAIKDYPSIKLLLKFNTNVKLFLMSYLFRFSDEEIKKFDKLEEFEKDGPILKVVECFLRLFTIHELIDAGYSNSFFKTFLFKENLKLVNQNVSEEEIVHEFNNHIKGKWKEDNLREELKEYSKNVLVYLNEYLYSKEINKPFKLSDRVNIEHIAPSSGRNKDSIREDVGVDKETFERIVNLLGNKILLEEDINKSIGDDWFRTKKQNYVGDKRGYKDSQYNLALDMVTYPSDKWTQDDINRNTEKATDRILKFIFGE